MARNYDLNTNAAKEANSGGKRITEPGLYVGAFRAAWYEQNDNGTESVGLFFASDQGQEAGPLMLYTHKADGTELPSFKTLNAIMACMKVRKLEAKDGKVKFYDFDSKQDVERKKEIYPALMGRIGLVLQAEEYQANNGDTKHRLLIAAPFEASTRLMAAEILDKQTAPRALDNYLVWFEKNKVKKASGNGSTRPSRQSAPAHADGDDDFDSVPF